MRYPIALIVLLGCAAPITGPDVKSPIDDAESRRLYAWCESGERPLELSDTAHSRDNRGKACEHTAQTYLREGSPTWFKFMSIACDEPAEDNFGACITLEAQALAEEGFRFDAFAPLTVEKKNNLPEGVRSSVLDNALKQARGKCNLQRGHGTSDTAEDLGTLCVLTAEHLLLRQKRVLKKEPAAMTSAERDVMIEGMRYPDYLVRGCQKYGSGWACDKVKALEKEYAKNGQTVPWHINEQQIANDRRTREITDARREEHRRRANQEDAALRRHREEEDGRAAEENRRKLTEATTPATSATNNSSPDAFTISGNCGDECTERCKDDKARCAKGETYKCYDAAACLCECHKAHNGCGSSVQSLDRCIQENRAKSAALSGSKGAAVSTASPPKEQPPKKPDTPASHSSPCREPCGTLQCCQVPAGGWKCMSTCPAF